LCQTQLPEKHSYLWNSPRFYRYCYSFQTAGWIQESTIVDSIHTILDYVLLVEPCYWMECEWFRIGWKIPGYLFDCDIFMMNICSMISWMSLLIMISFKADGVIHGDNWILIFIPAIVFYVIDSTLILLWLYRKCILNRNAWKLYFFLGGILHMSVIKTIFFQNKPKLSDLETGDPTFFVIY
jgi:hypothetical protein